MKHKYTMLAIAANMLLLASCNREQIAQSGSISVNYQPVVGNSAQNVAETKSSVISSTDGSLEIPFNCVVSEQMGPQKDTKGTLYNRTGSIKNLESEGLTQFEVQIFKDDKTAITTSGYEKVNYSSSKWTGTTMELPEYSTGNYEFFAQANKGSQSISINTYVYDDLYNSDGFYFDYYDEPKDCREQVDYLIGYYGGTAEDDEIKANIQFIHPLTSVIFKLGDIDGVSSIKRIELSGVYDYCEALVDYSYDASGNLTPEISWQEINKPDDPVFLDPKADANPKVLEVNNTTKVVGEPFILIPQDLEDAPVTINVYAITTTSDIICLSKELDSGEWESGKTYTYTLGASPKPTITKTGSVNITGISAVAGTYTTATGLFSLENAEIDDVTASTMSSNISNLVAKSDGSITFDITANTDISERNAGTITLSVAGGNSIDFSVIQKGKPYIDYATSGSDYNIIYVSAAADTYTTEDAVFSLKNGAVIGSVTASSTDDITSPTANSNGTITYTVTANTDTNEKTVGTIKLTYSDGDYIEFTVKQKGKPYISIVVGRGTINNVPATGGDDYSLTSDTDFTLGNGATISKVEYSGCVSAASYNSGGTVSYTVSQNTATDATTGTVKVYINDTEYVTFTINQLAAGSSITLWEGVYTYSTTDISAKFGGSSSNSFKSGVTVSDITGKKLYVTTDGTGWINNAFILPGHNDPWHIQNDAVAREGNLLYMTRGMTEDEATALLNGGLGFNAGSSAKVTKIEVR